MIQLPSKIRTTLFNATVDTEPTQLFSHEDDRLLTIIYDTGSNPSFPSFGRSGQDALNSDYFWLIDTHPIYLYGPEPIWVCSARLVNPTVKSFIVVHGIYRA